MGGYTDGDAVQVDVSSTVLHQTSLSSLPPSPVPGSNQRGNSTGLLLPLHLDAATRIRNILSNLDIHITDTYPTRTQYDPASLQYMLDFFRTVAQTIPTTSDNASDSQNGSEAGSGLHPLDPAGNRVDDSSKRAGIIVLREDLDFYAIPPKQDIAPAEMLEVKRAAARVLLRQDGIFSGLKKSDEPGTTEAHLIEMLTAG